MIRLPIWILIWIAYMMLKAVTYATGLIVVAPMWFYRHRYYLDLPFWTRPWANPEDWQGQIRHHAHSLPKWYVLSKGAGFGAWYHYHAIRNGANGLRSFELLDMDIVPELIQYKTNMPPKRYEPSDLRAIGKKTGGYIAWIGFYAGFEIMHIWPDKKKDTHYWLFGKRVIKAGPRHFVMKIGWRVEPRYKTDPIPELFLDDAGFAGKFLMYREG